MSGSSPPRRALTLPSSALVTGALLLEAPIDPRSALGRLTRPDLAALERADLTEAGRPRPWFASLVELVAWPELAVELVRRRPGCDPSRTLVWARSDAAVVGTLAGGAITVAPIAVASVAEHIVEACAVSEHQPDLADPRLVAELLAALLADDAPGATAAIDRASDTDSPDVPLLANLLTVVPTTWRLETAWTDRDGHRGGVLGALDAGPLGTWEISGTAHPLDLRPTTSTEVQTRVVELLPATAAVYQPHPPADQPKGQP